MTTISNGLVRSDSDVSVEFTWIGEGICGDYNEADPDDRPLMRFYVQRLVGDEWQDVEDASYCTNIDARTDEALIAAHAETILNQVKDDVRVGKSIKKICEYLSWLEG